MTTETTPQTDRGPRRWKRLGKACTCGCLGCASMLGAAVALVFFRVRSVSLSYPPVVHPIVAPALHRSFGGLKDFESPYIGHTGSWDGKGGEMNGRSKTPEMDMEQAMGLKWTFMPVYWSALEPDGPVVLTHETPSAWKELDSFVIEAQRRGLNILMQAPVVGGNAGGPPRWAGTREPGKSAPERMEALVDFAGKLTERYRPGGALAHTQGWGDHYGVRAWELDNEPASYRTNWAGQAADYAEFVTKAAARIRRSDPHAVIITPANSSSEGKGPWIVGALDASRRAGSPELRKSGESYSIGPATDVVSFHNYEGLDSAFAGQNRTIETVFSEIRDSFERYENQAGFTYAPKQEYWHTEGNYDFFGTAPAKLRASWRIQFMTRAFAAGIRKLVVMDPSVPEQVAVRTYVSALPDPFPMERATDQIMVTSGKAVAFRHPDRSEKPAGQVWIVWAIADTGDAAVEIPVTHDSIEVLTPDGRHTSLSATHHHVTLHLNGDAKMPPPLIILDRPTPTKHQN